MPKFSLSDKSVLYIGSNMLQTVVTLGWGVLLVRYLSKYEYGTLQQIMLLRHAAETLVLMGLHQSLFYFIPKAPDASAKKGIIFQTFFLFILLGGTAGIGMYLLGPFLATSFNNSLLAADIGIYSLFFVFDIPFMLSKAVFLTLDRVFLASIVAILSPALLVSVTVTSAVLGYGFHAILVGMLVIFIVQFVLFTGYLLKLPGSIRSALSLKSLREQFSYSLPLGVSAIPDVFKRQLDKFVIASFYLPDQFAVYSRGAFELPFVSNITYSLNHILLPNYVRSYQNGDHKKMLYIWNESIRRIALIFFPLFVFAFIFADKIITLLYTEAYSQSASVFRIYLCLLPFRIAGYRVILRAVGDTRKILVSSIIALSANIGLNIVFANEFGFNGPALAAVLSEIISILYLLFSMKKLLNFPIKDLLPVKSLFFTFIISALIGAAFLPLMWVDWSQLVILAASSLLFLVIYMGVMKKAKLFSDGDWSLITKWVTLKVIR